MVRPRVARGLLRVGGCAVLHQCSTPMPTFLPGTVTVPLPPAIPAVWHCARWVGHCYPPPQEGVASRSRAFKHVDNLAQLIGKLSRMKFAKCCCKLTVIPERILLRTLESCPDAGPISSLRTSRR